jgi:hypothetical protein
MTVFCLPTGGTTLKERVEKIKDKRKAAKKQKRKNRKAEMKRAASCVLVNSFHSFHFKPQVGMRVYYSANNFFCT